MQQTHGYSHPLKRIFPILATALALTGGLIACGDDDESGVTSDDTPPNSDGDEDTEPPSDSTQVIVRSSTLSPNPETEQEFVSGTLHLTRSEGVLSIVLDDDFEQLSGPGDTEVFFARSSENIDAQREADSANVSERLGVIPNGGSGTFSFSIGGNIDPDDYDYIVIWCPNAGVNFGWVMLPFRSGILAGNGSEDPPDASGDIEFTRNEDGNLIINLGENFMQEEGPGNTQLFLARSGDNIDEQRAEDAGSVSEVIGVIENGASGAFSFTIPEGVDVDLFDYVVVWCAPAGINFGTAQLQ